MLDRIKQAAHDFPMWATYVCALGVFILPFLFGWGNMVIPCMIAAVPIIIFGAWGDELRRNDHP